MSGEMFTVQRVTLTFYVALSWSRGRVDATAAQVDEAVAALVGRHCVTSTHRVHAEVVSRVSEPVVDYEAAK